jgi:1,4-dihydroxy-2-naphthoyl-CoA hydrolase
MPFIYARTIRFADTDAAGVVFFPNYFAICHEAYEEALAVAGIELAGFFREQDVLVPIARTEAEYLRPLRAGDKITVSVTPQLLSPDSFAIRYELHRTKPVTKLVARVRTEHVATSMARRERVPLPVALRRWIDATATT